MTASRARAPRNADGSQHRRRARVAASLAAPLSLGAAVDDHEAWPEDRLQREIMSLRETLDERLQRQYPGVPGMRLLVFHDQDSRKNVRGLPDLIIAGPGGTIFVELKRQLRSNERPEQKVWLDVLAAGGAAAYLWRPADWQAGTIQNELYRIARPIRTSPSARRALPLAVQRKGCGCPADSTVHTCDVWGPPS